MAKTKEPVNPFYIVLVICGIVFFVTAVAYWQMAYRAIAPVNRQPGAADVTGHALIEFMEAHGMQLLAGELALLGAATFAAMWLDQFRTNRIQRASGIPPRQGNEPPLPGENGNERKTS